MVGIISHLIIYSASLVAQMVKNLSAMWETRVLSLGWEDPLEEEMATHCSILAGEFHGQRGLAGYSPQGRKESDTTDVTWHSTAHGRYQQFMTHKPNLAYRLFLQSLWAKNAFYIKNVKEEKEYFTHSTWKLYEIHTLVSTNKVLW